MNIKAVCSDENFAEKLIKFIISLNEHEDIEISQNVSVICITAVNHPKITISSED